ncbi:MAG: winged helix-turn-helix domain-containing protein [Pseudomonadota bacterium]
MPKTGPLKVAQITVDPALYQLSRGPRVLQIEPRAMQVLSVLLAQRNQVVRREVIFREVWGRGEASDDTLNRLIFDLRRTLRELDPGWEPIETIRRVGYRWVERKTPLWRRRGAAAAAALVVLAAAALLLSRPSQVVVGTVRPLSADLGLETYPAFSPDGSTVYFGCSPGDRGSGTSVALCRRDVGGSVIETVLEQVADGVAPHPDGVHLAFQTATGDCTINRLNQRTGEQVRLTPCLDRNDGSLAWSADGQWLYFSDRTAAGGPFRIKAVNFAGAETLPISRPAPDTVGDLYPTPSPDGTRLAFFRASSAPATTTYITPGSGRVWHGWLNQAQFAQTPEPLAPGAAETQVTGLAWYNRDLLWFANPDGREFALLISRDGKAAPVSLGTFTGIPRHPTISNQGLVIAEAWSADADLWRLSLANDNAPQRVLSSTRFDLSPTFAPDGERVAWVSARRGRSEIYIGSLADNRVIRRLDPGDGFEAESPKFSPDGQQLVFERRRNERSEVAVYDLSSGTLRQLPNPDGQSRAPSFAADGQSVFLASDRSGSWNIWQQMLEDESLRQVTRGGGYGHASRGDLLVFSRRDEPGLWRQDLTTGAVTQLSDRLPPWSWGNWVLVEDEVWAALGNSSGDTDLVAIDVANGQSRTLRRLPQPLLRESTNLAAAPDGQTIVFALRSFLSADLIQFSLSTSGGH